MAGGARSASVVDVAAEAGVSLGTVSNVLNRPERVSDATRLRVEKAMARLGFVRNESARQLRAGQSRLLAYVMLDVANPFFTDVAQGIDSAAAEHELALFLCNSANDAGREAAYLTHLSQQRVQGILVTPVDPHSPLLEEIVKHTPVVIVDRTRDDKRFCSAAADDVAGGRLAVEHLIDRGHTRIAYIGGPPSLGQVRERHEGALLACRESGLAEDALLHIGTDGLGFADGREAGERLIGIPAKRRPTAAFCANDLVALGLLQQMSLSGRTVPDDLAIVGFDDIDFAGAAAVPLTSVRQPRRELGRRAAELLLDEASNPDHEHRQVIFTPELVARRSTLN
ncbi:MAG: lacI [Nocardioides sp.]|nr:lacI [Nocardioides sp.]